MVSDDDSLYVDGLDVSINSTRSTTGAVVYEAIETKLEVNKLLPNFLSKF